MTIEELYRKNRFIEIITKYANSPNISELYYVVASYIGINQIDKALSVIEEFQDGFLKAFPKEIISLHLDLLLEEKRIDEALRVLENYEEKPYISYEIEELLKEWKEKLIKYKYSSSSSTNERNLHSKLLGDDSSIQTEVIVSLFNEDIDDFIRDFKVILDDENSSPMVQSLILLLLLSKKYDGTFILHKLGLTYEINPCELEPIIDKVTINNLINEVININNITLAKTIEFILMRYSLALYPERAFDYDYIPLILASSLLASRTLNEYHDEICQIITKNQLDISKMERLSYSIDEIIGLNEK